MSEGPTIVPNSLGGVALGGALSPDVIRSLSLRLVVPGQDEDGVETWTSEDVTVMVYAHETFLVSRFDIAPVGDIDLIGLLSAEVVDALGTPDELTDLIWSYHSGTDELAIGFSESEDRVAWVQLSRVGPDRGAFN